MLKDASPTTYSYEDAASVLSHLGFVLAPAAGGSHRKWRCKTPDGNTVVVGLVDRGSGTLKAYLIRDMLGQLRDNSLIPGDLDQQ